MRAASVSPHLSICLQLRTSFSAFCIVSQQRIQPSQNFQFSSEMEGGHKNRRDDKLCPGHSPRCICSPCYLKSCLLTLSLRQNPRTSELEGISTYQDLILISYCEQFICHCIAFPSLTFIPVCSVQCLALGIQIRISQIHAFRRQSNRKTNIP